MVALYVMSHDHGYVLTQEAIAHRLDIAVRTVAAALVDLEDAGLLLRVAERNARGHRTGTAMHVSDVPFTDQERAELLGSLPAKSADAESADAESAGPKESNSKQESKQEEEQPFGGDAADASPPDVDELEDEMPRTGPDQEALFPSPEKPKKPRKAPSLPEGAAAVVAAFVDSYSASHEGRRPLGSDIGKVGQAARLILNRQEATEAQLIACASKMGRGDWSNLAQELKFSQPATPKSTMPRPQLHDDPAWASVVSTVQGDTLSDEEFAEAFGVGV